MLISGVICRDTHLSNTRPSKKHAPLLTARTRPNFSTKPSMWISPLCDLPPVKADAETGNHIEVVVDARGVVVAAAVEALRVDEEAITK